MTEPSAWPHPTNPTAARRAQDGRIAFRLWIALDDSCGAAEQRWYVADAPDGRFTLTLLTDEEVGDWTPLDLDGP